MALSMAFGRGAAARAIVDASKLGATDRVVDIGSGPGTAIRVASRRCSEATGVDPSPGSRRLGNCLNRVRGCHNATIIDGAAESLALPDDSATVAWAIASYHHWPDQAAALAEAKRVLVPGGRLLVMERLVKPDAKGHALHWLSTGQLHEVELALASAGFDGVVQNQLTIGRTAWSIVSGRSRTS